jgi:hypothetical protein
MSASMIRNNSGLILMIEYAACMALGIALRLATILETLSASVPFHDHGCVLIGTAPPQGDGVD